jgi:hypothetical protein
MKLRNASENRKKLAEAKADEEMFVAMRQRFERLGLVQLVFRHLTIVATAGIAFWGVSQGWTLGVLLLFFAVEFAVVMVLNALSIIFLPVKLVASDHNAIAFWKRALPVAAIAAGIAYYLGYTSPLDWLIDTVHAKGLLWPLVGVAAIQVADFIADLSVWQKNGGNFFYWSGVLVTLRLFFYIVFGFFFGFFLGSAAGDDPTWLAGGFVVLSLGADLFAFWVPELAYRIWHKERYAKPAP